MKKHILNILAASAFAACLLSACDADMYTVSARLDEPYYERPVSPGAGYVWISGDWVRSSNGYSYRQGYWSRPRGTRVYVAGNWQQRGNGYYWQRGHWR
ncbi:MAG: hypothetical protein V4539_10460 [Bacteroidota bacterium]